MHKLSIRSEVCFFVKLNCSNCLESLTCNKVVRSLTLYTSFSGRLFTGNNFLKSVDEVLKISEFVILFKYQTFWPIVDLGSFTKTLHKNLISLLGDFISFWINYWYLPFDIYSWPLTSIFGLVNSSIKKMRLDSMSGCLIQVPGLV